MSKELQFFKFSMYGFLKNLRFYEPFIILFFLQNNLTYFQIGVLYSIREITNNLFQIPSGLLADMFGRKRILASSFILYILSFVAFYFSENFVLFAISMFVFGGGEASRSGTHKAMIYTYLEKNGRKNEKVGYYGYTRSWSQAGSAVSALVSGTIVLFTGNYRLIFLLSAIPYLMDLILILTYPPYLDGKKISYNAGEFIKIFKLTLKNFIIAIKNLIFIKVVINSSAFSGYYKTIKDFIQPAIKSFAIGLPVMLSFTSKERSAVLVGVVYFIIYFLSSFSSAASGWFTRFFSNYSKPLNITLISGLLAGVLAGVFFHFDLPLISIILFLTIYLIQNLRKPVSAAVTSNLVHEDIYATALSVDSQLQTVVTAALSPLLGLIADKWGLGIGLAAISLIMLFSTPFYLIKRKFQI